MPTVVQGLDAAPDGLRFELSLGPAAGCGYPGVRANFSVSLTGHAADILVFRVHGGQGTLFLLHG